MSNNRALNKITYIVLAGGNSSRFAGGNKLLHNLCGQPVLDYVLDKLPAEQTLVVTSPATNEHIRDRYKTIIQEDARGTGHAFLLALDHIDDESDVFILLGDMPLVTKNTISKAIDLLSEHDLVFGRFQTSSCYNSYGRVFCDNKRYYVREASESPEPAMFYNAGWLCIRKDLVAAIRRSEYNANTSEIYLTRYIEMAKNPSGLIVDEAESIGINTTDDYAQAHAYMQRQFIRDAIGVNFTDPRSVNICYDTRFAPGVTVHGNVVFGKGVNIGAGSEIFPFSVIESSVIGEGCKVGPFCYIRNGTELKPQSQAGAFCEIKNSTLGIATKAKHLSYIGDTTLGDRVNVGAGTVFLNYDGMKKNPCTVGNDTFLGGNSCYVAPVNIGAESYIGAGTVVRQDVPENSIYVTKPKNLHCRRK